jgi:PIN domain nuclease of toxin-antitoxin system
MARLLLDTNVLLMLVEGVRMPPRITRALAGAGSGSYASVASFWETAIKVRLGKLSIRIPLLDLPGFFRGYGLTVLAVDESHALTDLNSQPATNDPFDRLLLAQCQVEGLRLVTIDRALVDHPLAWRDA